MQNLIKRPTLALLVAVLLLGTNVYAQETTLVIGATAEAPGLDPRVEVDAPAFERINTMMEPLVAFGTDLGLKPRLATDWEFSEDGLTLTFTLRQGVLFHHGREFVAEDVKYTYEWLLDPDNDAPNRPLYADIESIETPDDTTVVFNLSEANSFLLNNLARMPILPHDLAAEEEFRDNPVGTGPLMFESWDRDDRMVLRAFEDYWGGRPQVDVVEFRPIPEDATRLLAFEGRQLDMYQGGVVPAELARLEEDPAFVVQRTPGTGYTYVGFNLRSEPLADVRVRQAVSHLIPREAIVERIMEGIGEPGISMISPDMPWFNPDVARFEYDPERAEELLAEAGIEEGTTLRLYTHENPVRIQIAEILEFELGQIGIDVDVTIEEWGAFLNRLTETEDYDMFILGWVGQIDPDRAMSRQFTTDGAFANFIYYSNERVDELLTRGPLVAPDSEESIELYQEAQAIIVEAVPYAFINYTEEVGLHHPYIEGWEIHPYSPATYQNVHEIVKDR